MVNVFGNFYLVFFFIIESIKADPKQQQQQQRQILSVWLGDKKKLKRHLTSVISYHAFVCVIKTLYTDDNSVVRFWPNMICRKR